MTLLTKPVRRETDIPADHHGRNIIIELDPGPPCVIRFREKGRRHRIDASVSWLYFQVVKADAERKLRERKKQREEKRKAKRGLLSI